jgi:hypothetical protein
MDENKQDQDLQAQVEDAKFQLSVLKNVAVNLFVDGKLRADVKEKDIQMLSDAIVKIKSNFKEIMSEIEIMKSREIAIETKHSKTRKDFIAFAKEFGIKIPSIIKDYYQIDG